jgi:hypothetical protein
MRNIRSVGKTPHCGRCGRCGRACGRPRPPAPARFFIFGPRAHPRPQDFRDLAPAPAHARKNYKIWPPRPQEIPKARGSIFSKKIS